jgi:5-oxoprolinase (ATP-hydrolysing)
MLRSTRSAPSCARGARAHARGGGGGLRRGCEREHGAGDRAGVGARAASTRASCALVGFGGAGGQHVCAVARSLGMRDVLLHPFAGILSAWGIGLSGASWDGQRDARRARLPDAARRCRRSCADGFAELERAGARCAVRGGRSDAALRVERRLDLRHVGTEAALPVASPRTATGPVRSRASTRCASATRGRVIAIEITALRVRVFARRRTRRGCRARRPARPRRCGRAAPSRSGSRTSVASRRPVYWREDLAPGHAIAGPALVLEATSTVC